MRALDFKPLLSIIRGFCVLKKNQEIMAALKHKLQYFFTSLAYLTIYIFTLLEMFSSLIPMEEEKVSSTRFNAMHRYSN